MRGEDSSVRESTCVREKKKTSWAEKAVMEQRSQTRGVGGGMGQRDLDRWERLRTVLAVSLVSREQPHLTVGEQDVSLAFHWLEYLTIHQWEDICT